ncbi:GGDEF domain-containing protein [Paraburkholderia sp. BR14263]|uniref:GGDEF domain-containing protein n=1 Tax=unclassified Paraburkholderia TaxID=2615204 RepID=UPI0034CEAEF6
MLVQRHLRTRSRNRQLQQRATRHAIHAVTAGYGNSEGRKNGSRGISGTRMTGIVREFMQRLRVLSITPHSGIALDDIDMLYRRSAYSRRTRMPLFDLRTVILMSSVMPGLMAIALFSLARSFPQNIRGVRHWASGALVVSVSVLLLAFRGSVPDWLSILVANCGIVFGAGLGLVGTQLLYGCQPSWRFVSLLVSVAAAGMTWLWLVHPSIAGRMIVITGVLAVLYGTHGVVMLRLGRPSRTALAVGALLLAECAVAAARCISIGLATKGLPDLFHPEWMQTFYLTAGAAFSLLVTVGLLLIAMERLRIQLERQSYRDPLTGLLNRRALALAFEEERELAKRNGAVLSMLLIDLDHFKRVNDEHGHDMGDNVLIDFAERASAAIPASACLARWGGEEFAVLLPALSLQQAHELAEVVRTRIAEPGFTAPVIRYTCSIGVACLAAAEATIQQLARDADTALYHAKHLGRNRVEICDRAFAA